MNRVSQKEMFEAIALRKFGKLDLQYISPNQAAGLVWAGRLTAKEINTLANIWIDTGLDKNSPELAVIALNKPTSLRDAEPAFIAALTEMGVEIGEIDESILTLLEVYLDAIIEERLPAMVAMAALNEIYNEYYDDGRFIPGKPLIQHPKHKPDDTQRYVGQDLGLQYLYTWYREFQDAQDNDDSTWYYNELPLDQQLVKFDEELIDEAKVLYDHLGSLYPTLFKNTKN